jgi:hypothetical protein
MKAATIQSFISTNASAYAAASKVFVAIEAKDFAQVLAEAGILPQDIKVFAIVWVSEQTRVNGSQVMPKEGQRGLTFKKDSTEDNRVKYLVSVATGKAAVKAAKRPKASDKAVPLTRVQKAAVAALLAAFDGDMKAARAAIV